MGDAPDDIHAIIVDDVFLHYDIVYDDADERVHIHCNRCDDIVAVLSYDAIVSMTEMDLLEYIIAEHKPL